MALTSSDETDLLLPLHRSVHEEPRFATFLGRLQRRTAAEYVGLIIRRVNSPAAEMREYFAGIDLRKRARALGIEELYTLEDVHHDRLRPGRVYAVSEFVDHDPEYADYRARNVERIGIVDERVVRVYRDEDSSAWLVLARGEPCSAADSALLSSLAPYVAAAIHSLILLERQRIAVAMATEGLGRSGVGWILLDRDARVLAIDPATERRLRDMTGIIAQPGKRLRDATPQVERDVARAAAELSGNPQAPAQAVVLCEEPRVEAVLVCANALEVASLAVPATLAMCRFPRTASPERADRLARLFDLPRREAQLAIALSDGQSIAEAADTMGLTLETARNYSKRLYAKLGIRGQAELVRRVYESSAMLA